MNLPQRLPRVGLPRGFAERRQVAERKLEQREMYEILGQEILSRFFHGDTPLDELALEEPIPDSRGARRTVHELRYMQLTISEAGVVGKVTPSHFRAHQVGVPIHAMRRDLQQEQPSCDWWIVAFQVELRDLSRTDEVWGDVVDSRAIDSAARGGGRVFGERNPNVRATDFADQDPDATYPQAVSQARVRSETDYQAVVHIAWADIKRSRLVDPVTHLHRRYNPDNNDVSFMREYAQTRNLDVLPEGSRLNREMAKAVMRYFADEQRMLEAEAQQLGTTDDPPEAPAPKQARAPKPPAEAKAGGQLDDRKRALIIELRQAGETPANIAKRVRVKTAKVLEVLEQGEADDVR